MVCERCGYVASAAYGKDGSEWMCDRCNHLWPCQPEDEEEHHRTIQMEMIVICELDRELEGNDE